MSNRFWKDACDIEVPNDLLDLSSLPYWENQPNRWKRGRSGPFVCIFRESECIILSLLKLFSYLNNLIIFRNNFTNSTISGIIFIKIIYLSWNEINKNNNLQRGCPMYGDIFVNLMQRSDAFRFLIQEMVGLLLVEITLAAAPRWDL